MIWEFSAPWREITLSGLTNPHGKEKYVVQINVTGRHVEVTEEVKKYAREKAEKLLRFYDRIEAIEVVLDHEGGVFTVKYIVNAGSRNEFIGTDSGPEMFAIIDRVVDKLERQITKHKERFRNRMHVTKKPPSTEE